MGYFSTYIGGRKPTKNLVAGRIAALIRCVVDDVGLNGLVAGSIVLKNNFTVAFQCGGGRGEVVATVQLDRYVSDSEIQAYSSMLTSAEGRFFDRITYAVIKEFENQSSNFAQLESLFTPIGQYVFVCRSAQYRNAEKKHDDNEMGKLLRRDGGGHYVMETYENMGGAKAREGEMGNAFVGGVVDSYEQNIF